MPLLRATVNVTDDFRQVTVVVNELARHAVEAAAREGAAAAAAVASARSKTGRMASITPDNAIGTADGWAASFVSPTHYAWFQNYGTLGNRRKRLKQPPRGSRTREQGTGIEPLGFLEAGRRAGRRAMLRTIKHGV
jgi:hypothetical protein